MKTYQSQKFEKRVLLVPLPHFLGTGGRRDGPPGVIRLLQQNRGRPLQAAHLKQHQHVTTLNIGRLIHDDAISLSRGRLRAGRPWRKTKVGESVTAACCVYLWRRNCRECRWWPRCGGGEVVLMGVPARRGTLSIHATRRARAPLPATATQSTTVLGGQILTPPPSFKYLRNMIL